MGKCPDRGLGGHLICIFRSSLGILLEGWRRVPIFLPPLVAGKGHKFSLIVEKTGSLRLLKFGEGRCSWPGGLPSQYSILV